MSMTNVETISGQTLLVRLNAIPGLVAENPFTVFREARTRAPIMAAQLVLETAGYVLSGCELAEGYFYRLRYTAGGNFTDPDHWPRDMFLHYLTAPTGDDLQLVLVYYSHRRPLFYGDNTEFRSDLSLNEVDKLNTVYRRDSPTALTLVSQLQREFPSHCHAWAPIFTKN